MNHLRHQNYQRHHTEIKYLNNIQKDRILKTNNSLLKSKQTKMMKKRLLEKKKHFGTID